LRDLRSRPRGRRRYDPRELRAKLRALEETRKIAKELALLEDR
jgi:hypothetical protein